MTSNGGPVPKRSDQRRRVNKDPVPVVTGQAALPSPLGPAAPRDLHGDARRWYEALRTSGQAVYYTGSDWATAMVVARGIEAFQERRSAVMLAAILHGCGSLIATEGDRRRARIELARGGADPDREAGAVSMQAWRDKLTGSAG